MIDDIAVSEQEMFDRFVKMRDQQHQWFKMRLDPEHPQLNFTLGEYNDARAQLVNRLIKSRGFWLFSEQTSINIGPGWFNIVGDLVAQIATFMSQPSMKDYNFKFLQIKEKFGDLRVHFRLLDSHGNTCYEYSHESAKQLNDLVYCAYEKACDICEYCGNPGESRDLKWVKTLCDYHAANL